MQELTVLIVLSRNVQNWRFWSRVNSCPTVKRVEGRPLCASLSLICYTHREAYCTVHTEGTHTGRHIPGGTPTKGGWEAYTRVNTSGCTRKVIPGLTSGCTREAIPGFKPLRCTREAIPWFKPLRYVREAIPGLIPLR